MPRASTPKPASPAVQPSSDGHSFAIGQAVHLKRSFMVRPSAGVYYITATVPSEYGPPRYRVRNDEERYERVVAQDSMEPAFQTQGGAGKSLQERTFGRG